MPKIRRLRGLEVLDSRGRPTVWASCTLASGAEGSVSIPSGASTGSAEALELRDGDPRRYRGLGCRKAVANIAGEIGSALSERSFDTQQQLDEVLLVLDGTPNKVRLGANALLAASLAFARASAAESRMSLHEYLASLAGRDATTLPRLMVNLFSGGKHAGGQVPIQDVLVLPVSPRTVDDSLAVVYEVYRCASELARERYDTRELVADEGGLAPPFPSVEAMVGDAVEAVLRAGLKPGKDVALAVDVAATHFYSDRGYNLGSDLNSMEMIDTIVRWLEAYPIISVEDGLAENDWESWPSLRKRLRARALTLGDDLLCTNPVRIQRAIQSEAADALLLKVNQIGTLTEAARSLRLARSANWKVVVSARSGETEDSWLADLAVGWGGDYIKIGSITRSERLAKYNRLLAIESETRLPLANR